MPFLELDHARVHYDVYGTDGPWITLLHGGLVDMASLADLATRLAVDMRVVTLDVRGYGQSRARDGDLSLAASTGDVIGLLDHLAIDRSTVFGFSMGGMIAQRIALDHPDRIDALVLMSTGSRTGPTKAEAFRARADRIASQGLGPEREEHVVRAFSPDWLDAHPEEFRAYADRVLDNDPDVVAATMRSIAEFDVTAELPRLEAPVLILAGELDQGFGPDVANETATHLRDAVVEVVVGAGHTIHLEQPAEVARHINEFVGSGSRSPHVPTDNDRST